MVLLRSFCGLVTSPNRLWLRPAINWSQPVWTGVVLYICSNKDIFITILLAQGVTHAGCPRSTWQGAHIQRGGVAAFDMVPCPRSEFDVVGWRDTCIRRGGVLAFD